MPLPRPNESEVYILMRFPGDMYAHSSSRSTGLDILHLGEGGGVQMDIFKYNTQREKCYIVRVSCEKSLQSKPTGVPSTQIKN